MRFRRLPKFNGVFHLLCVGLLCCATGCVPHQSRFSKFPVAKQRVAKQQPVDRKFEVTVTAQGDAVVQPERQLVHRITLSRGQLQELARMWPKKAPVIAELENDQFGVVLGLRVTAVLDPSHSSLLGLRLGDLITAIGKEHANQRQGMLMLLDTLAKVDKETLTLVREGQPHKIFYHLHP